MLKMLRVSSVLGVVLFALVFWVRDPMTVRGQSISTGTIAGTVTDPSGAAVAGATVTLTNLGTSTSRTAATNETGRYVLANVEPGTYSLTINKTGFRVAKFSNQVVNIGGSLTLNVTLEIGATTQVVEVTATNAELQTMNATVGNTITGVAPDSLPGLGRDVSTFVSLQPGFAGDPSGGVVNSYATGTGVAGAPGGGGPSGVMPTPVDSIEEFRVGTTNQTADFNSSAGAQVQMVTKRGTNQYHGTVYEYYLDNNWSGNTFDNNATGTKLPSYHYSHFGAAGGGPAIPKNILGGKTYIFAN